MFPDKKGQNKLLAQGPSPGGRENGSRGSSRHNSKQSTEKPEYSLTDVPSNMVLIHDDSKSKTSEVCLLELQVESGVTFPTQVVKFGYVDKTVLVDK